MSKLENWEKRIKILPCSIITINITYRSLLKQCFNHSHKKKNSLETPVNPCYFHADAENYVILEPILLQRDGM